MALPSPTSRRKNKVYVSMWDLFWALVSPPLTLWLGDALVLAQQDWSMTIAYCALSSGFAVVAFIAFRLQDTMTRHFSAHEVLDIAEAVLFAEVLTFGFLFTLTRLDGFPRSVLIYHGLLLGGGLIFIRILTRFAATFISMLSAYAHNRERVVAVLDEKSGAIGRALGGVQVLGTPQELDAIVGEFAVHGVHIDRVILAGDTDLLSSAAMHDVERVCKKRHLVLSYLPRMLGLTEQGSSGLEVVAAADSGPERHFFLRWKRFIDVVGLLALMILLLPLFVIATLLVMIDVGSPVLFWQERTGWRGRPFLIYRDTTLAAP